MNGEDETYTPRTLEDVEEEANEEIARLVSLGHTSGLVEDGEGGHVSWELRKEVWIDD